MDGETLRLGDERGAVSIAMSDAVTAASVARLFEPLRLATGRAGTGTDDEAPLEIERAGPCYRLVERTADGEVRTRRFRRLPSLLAAVEFAVLQRLLEGHHGETHLHASGAVVGGRAVLALGPSGAGKSSLALTWSRAGHPLLGDDVILADARGGVRGVPRLVKVSRRVLHAHGLSDDVTVAPDPRSPELWWDPDRGGGWARGVHRPALVARVSFERRMSTRLEPMTPAAGLRLLLDHVMEAGLKPEESLDRLARIAESATFVAVRFGSGRDAAAELAERAGGGTR
jgi:hypothetical protein